MQVRGDIKPQEQTQLYAAMAADQLPRQNLVSALERAYKDVEVGVLGVKDSARGTGSGGGSGGGDGDARKLFLALMLAHSSLSSHQCSLRIKSFTYANVQV